MKKVSKVFRYLIQLSTKPDIILQLLSDENYSSFFESLMRSEEEALKRKRGVIASFLETKTNSVFQIKNEEILESLQINYRIIFLKEFVFPELLS